MTEDFIFGRKPVEEALKEGAVDRLFLQKNNKGNVAHFQKLAKEANIKVDLVDKGLLDEKTDRKNHQGVLGLIKPFQYASYEEILRIAKSSDRDPFILVLDGVTDPQNLGAILRTAYLAGVHGVLIPKHRSAKVTATVFKASAGACAHIKLAQVTNINRTLEDLKKEGIWVYGADMGGQTYYKQDTTGPLALVLGAEGKGLTEPTKKHLDQVLSIPMEGDLDSLNVSVAAGILCFDILRQRHEKG